MPRSYNGEGERGERVEGDHRCHDNDGPLDLKWFKWEEWAREWGVRDGLLK